MKDSIGKNIGILLTVILLGGMIALRSMQNYSDKNYRGSNFFVFWLSGRLLTEGQNPYNPDQWQTGHEVYGVTNAREAIFLYPLPLAVLMVPLGLLTLDEAYLGWQIIAQLSIAMVVFTLLNRWDRPEHNRLFIPVVLFIFFFGPTYLTLQLGSIGPLTLIILFAAILFLEKKNSYAAGILLALTMLKPPQGISFLFLIGLWLLARRNWKALLGILLGGIFLWMLGMSIDLDWVSKFIHSGEAAFDRRLGYQSNLWSFSYLVCNNNMNCSFALGGVLSLIFLGSASYYLWRNHAKLTIWQVFNISILVGFISTIFLGSYDQLPYIIPIVWIVGTLVKGTKSYIYAFLFLMVLDLFSLFALEKQASTGRDLWSLGNTAIVLGMVMMLLYRQTKSIVEKDIPANV
ncbi:glycosyltransferase family 87 protein [Candidatus Villigracilis saccharophilus]|uniref:glycosyltransferase family 87 protein n=1 Tax=Candidatus Villigracilis saccharophilus TaxID=3140684 RepID=UPI003136E795|nr:DUF2029 domain-containing protein [Anaerolineales bacterium]